MGVLMHGLVGRLGPFDRFFADTARDFLGAFQCGGETLRASPTFSPATSAVAAIKALASWASVPMSLLDS